MQANEYQQRTIETEKECSHCGKLKPLTDFQYRKKRHSSEYYYISYCRVCARMSAKENYYKNHELSKLRLTQKKRYYNYGITETQFQSLLQKQDYSCAICGTITPGGKGNWHVDHDHDTGKVRGLLCHCCNTGLGLLQDSINILNKAKEYLIEYQ